MRAFVCVALLSAGCAGKRIVVPPDMRPAPVPIVENAEAGEVTTASVTREGRAPVIRLADAGRVWEVELPSDASPFELRIPLEGAGAAVAQTKADREVLGASEASLEEEANRPSWLAAIAVVNDLYRNARYELALLEVTKLEASFPDESKVFAMKGSICRRLGKKELAAKAWTRALELDPSDAVTAQALRALERGGN